MSPANLLPEPENPFSSRCIRPGAIAFLFPAGLDVGTLLDRLRVAGWRGEIVGPHGSGKSTLLAALRAALTQAGRTTFLIQLHDGERRLPVEQLAAAGEGDLLLVDGFEQLGLFARCRLARLCRRRKLGLVVTSHRPTGMPTLYRTSVDLTLARRLVEHLLGDRRDLVSAAEIAQSLACRRGDLREVLFDLYDLYENKGDRRIY